MKLYMSDLYRVELHYPLDEVQTDILYYLYQPLVGSDALQLYMMLVIEGKRMNRFLKPSSLSRLTSFLSINYTELEKRFQALEAIGLLKTFVKHVDQITQYIYQLQSPLTLKAFFKNQILSSLLQESLSPEDFQKTVQYFKINIEDLSEFEEVTVRFQDVFQIYHHRQHGRILKIKDELKEPLHQNIEVTYDKTLLLKSLADYQISKAKLTDEDFEYMIQLATVYSIDAFTLAGLVKDSMHSQGLERERLKTNIKNYFEMDSVSKLQEVYHKQPLQYQTQDGQQSPLVLHMKYLDNLTPYELLREKQGGKEPVFHDLKIVETLMVQLGLKPAVVNVLIEYVLGKNNNRLSKSYCETIGGSLARNHIETAMQAYEELMNDSRQNGDEKIEHVIEENTEVNSEKLFELLDKLEEGQL